MSASFGASGSGGIATALLGIDITKIKKQASQELYYALMLYCTESVEKIDQPYYMEASAAELLRKSGMRFFDDHGDRYVDTIQYGRWALVILQFRTETKAEQQKIAAKISTGVTATPLEVTGALSQSIQETFKNDSYDIKIYTGGLDYASTGTMKNIDGLDAIAQQFHVEHQKSQPVQMSWTSKPYMTVQHKQPNTTEPEEGLTVGARINARTLERLASNACHLAQVIKKGISAIEIYMQALNEDKLDRQLGCSFFMSVDESDTVEKIAEMSFDIGDQPEKDRLIYFLVYLRRIHYFLKIQSDKLTRREQCDPTKAREVALQTKKLIEALSKVYSSAPSTILLPLLRVPISVISGKNQTHKRGEYMFGLIPPDHSSFLQILSTGTIPKACKIRLKQRDFKKEGKQKVITLMEDHEIGVSTGPTIPITRGLSGLYLKSNETVQYPIDIYACFFPSYPTRDTLPDASELNEIITTFGPLSDLYNSFCRANEEENRLEKQSASVFQQQRAHPSGRATGAFDALQSRYTEELKRENDGRNYCNRKSDSFPSSQDERAYEIRQAAEALDRYTDELCRERAMLSAIEERISVKREKKRSSEIQESAVRVELAEDIAPMSRVSTRSPRQMTVANSANDSEPVSSDSGSGNGVVETTDDPDQDRTLERDRCYMLERCKAAEEHMERALSEFMLKIEAFHALHRADSSPTPYARQPSPDSTRAMVAAAPGGGNADSVRSVAPNPQSDEQVDHPAEDSPTLSVQPVRRGDADQQELRLHISEFGSAQILRQLRAVPPQQLKRQREPYRFTDRALLARLHTLVREPSLKSAPANQNRADLDKGSPLPPPMPGAISLAPGRAETLWERKPPASISSARAAVTPLVFRTGKY